MNNNPFKKNDLVLMSKWITSASYNFTETQENMLTKVQEFIAPYMGTDKANIRSWIELYRENGGFIMDIGNTTLKEISNSTNIKRVKEDIAKLQTKDFQITYIWKDENGKPWKRDVTLFSCIDKSIDGTICLGKINLDALPFLLYYGKGTGANIISMQKALTIKGKYAKRLYKILCGYVEKGLYILYIDKITKEWNISPKDVEKGNFKRYIERAIEQINNNDVGFSVTYKPILEIKKDGKGRPKVKAYQMVITSSKETENDNRKLYAQIYRIMQTIDRDEDNVSIIDRIFDMDKGKILISKFEYYRNEIAKSNINVKQLNAAMKKIITEEYLNKALPGNQ